jgi:hypothetical protein
MTKIAIINKTTCVSDADLASYVTAIQTQITNDFSPVWGVSADLVFVPKDHHPEPSMWWIAVLDDSDVAGALGYHDLTPSGFPFGKVFAKTDLVNGMQVSVTISHEVLEMLADPWIFSTVVGHTDRGQVLYALEVCDPCEDDTLGYKIGNVLVSDFIYPAWFDGIGTQFDFGKHITKPYQILINGYMSVMPLGVPGAGWHQITDSGGHSRVGNAAPMGSRRERRRAGKNNWKMSEVKSL